MPKAKSEYEVEELYIDRLDDMGYRYVELKNYDDVFTNRKVEDDFSVSVPYDDMTEKGCSFSAGQYFEVKIEHIDITPEEFNANMAARKERLTALFAKGHELETSVMEQMKEVYYGK